MIPFGASLFLSFGVLLALLRDDRPITVLNNSILDALTVAFFLTMLTSFWIAFRGQKRTFLAGMKYRVGAIGICCPIVATIIFLIFEYFQYGTPTQASPGLEITILTAICSGELLVRFASRPVATTLEKAG